MSGSFESVRWNACEHTLDFGLFSHPKEFWGNGVRAYVNSNSKGKKALSTGRGGWGGISPEEDGTHDAASSRTASPNTLPTELFRPLAPSVEIM